MLKITKKQIKHFVICTAIGFATGAILGQHLVNIHQAKLINANSNTIDNILLTLQSEGIIQNLKLGI